jgi:DNA-binding transcriptional LysR family regulator
MKLNLAGVDLKLLVAFEAIMAERSVSAAAARMGMSQPAMSNALGRLRLMLKDQLFTRTAEGMRPTARAIELAVPIAEALKKIQEALEPRRFNPSDGSWLFKLALSDQAAIVVLPRLLRRFGTAAPGIDLSVEPKSNDRIQGQLDAGEIDVAVGLMPNLAKRFAQAVLFEDPYVCMMRRDHPLAARPLTRTRFIAAAHLAIRPSPEGSSRIDQLLGALGIRRNVVLTANQYLAVPEILRETDLIACLFSSVARHFSTADFHLCPLPFAADPIRVAAAWSRARTQNGANAWLRQRLHEACADLRRPAELAAPRPLPAAALEQARPFVPMRARWTGSGGTAGRLSAR